MKENEEKETKKEKRSNKSIVNVNTNTTTLLLVATLIILFVFAGYILFNNNDNLDSDNQNEQPNTVEKPNEQSKITGPLTELDITKKEKLSKKIDRELKDVDGLPKDYDYPTSQYGANDAKVELNNGTLKYTFNDETFTIENVKQFKTDHVPYEMQLFAFTNDNEVWYCYFSHDAYMKKLDKTPTFKKLNGKYKDVKMLHMAYAPAGDVRDYLLVGTDDKYYSLYDESLYDADIYEHLNYQYTHDDIMKSYVKTNGDIYLNGKKTNIEFKLGLYNSYSEEIAYILSTDNYLYSSDLKKYSNSKVTKISYTDCDKNGMQSTVVEFADGTKLEQLSCGPDKIRE